MSLLIGRLPLRHLRLAVIWIFLTSASSAQILRAPETVQANPDGTFRYTVEFENGPEEDSLFGLMVSANNTTLVEPIVDWFCELITIPPGGRISFSIPSNGGYARLIDPTREGRVGFLLTLCGAGNLSVLTRILPDSPPPRIDTGETPVSVAAADFDGDSNPDLVTANDGSNDVTVLLGNGDGTFQAAVPYAVGLRPQSVAVADLNGDALMDLVTANAARDNVSVLLGNGDGTFQTALTFGAGDSPQSVAVADFNRDLTPDLVTANFSSNNASVLLGNGDGTFKPAVSFAASTGPTSAVTADLNGDTAPDLIVANQNSLSVSVLLGNGDGTFRAAVNYAVGSFPVDVTVADLDSDRVPDLVTSLATSDSLSVLLGNGNGTFRTASLFAAGDGPNSVAAADLDGDAILDLVNANALSDDVTVLLGNGDGTFQPAVSFSVGVFPRSAAVADFDDNSVPDVVAANALGNSVTVILNPFDPSIHATIDIKPSSAVNRINLSVRGLVPVALLGSEELAVEDVEVSTLAFGSNRISPAHDLTDPETLADHLRDVNQDGITDLVTHYSIRGAGFSIGDTEACLSGKLLNGRPFAGCDSVWVFSNRGARRSAR